MESSIDGAIEIISELDIAHAQANADTYRHTSVELGHEDITENNHETDDGQHKMEESADEEDQESEEEDYWLFPCYKNLDIVGVQSEPVVAWWLKYFHLLNVH